eukprot:TRINITY_DN77715_c0_g1_i1.p3 TRINITY_DN77715_c0_g1~~TRINITY_DN77715_c0_g1_i1.p3  ORF type:complete len:154 (-),score=50.13 TRINITY_DN77715_c0_g1_i1:154-615(-)
MGWQEINRTQWSRDFIRDLFKGASISLEGTEGATLSFFAVDTKGDCALAMKAGSDPRPMFELRIELDWKIEQPVDKGKSIVEAKGQVQVTEFCSEDIKAPQMKLICDNQLPPGATPGMVDLISKLNDAMKANGLGEISRMLSEDFVTALKQQA